MLSRSVNPPILFWSIVTTNAISLGKFVYVNFSNAVSALAVAQHSICPDGCLRPEADYRAVVQPTRHHPGHTALTSIPAMLEQ